MVDTVCEPTRPVYNTMRLLLVPNSFNPLLKKAKVGMYPEQVHAFSCKLSQTYLLCTVLSATTWWLKPLRWSLSEASSARREIDVVEISDAHRHKVYSASLFSLSLGRSSSPLPDKSLDLAYYLPIRDDDESVLFLAPFIPRLWNPF